LYAAARNLCATLTASVEAGGVSTHILAAERGKLDRIRLRLRVARQRTRLDAALAEGDDPDTDPALALRARQLTALATRRAIANAITNILDAAEEHPSKWAPGGPRPPLQRDQIVASQDALLRVADHLADRAFVPVRA